MAETGERALEATPLRRRGPHAPERVETKLVVLAGASGSGWSDQMRFCGFFVRGSVLLLGAFGSGCSDEVRAAHGVLGSVRGASVWPWV